MFLPAAARRLIYSDDADVSLRADSPCADLPGTPGKVEVMRLRIEAGRQRREHVSPFRADDATFETAPKLATTGTAQTANGVAARPEEASSTAGREIDDELALRAEIDMRRLAGIEVAALRRKAAKQKGKR